MREAFAPLILCLSTLSVTPFLSGCEGEIHESSTPPSAAEGPDPDAGAAGRGATQPPAATGGINGSGAGAAGMGAMGTGPSSGGVGDPVGSPPPMQGAFSRLTRAEYRATIQEALGSDPDLSLVPVDARIGPFTANSSAAPDPVHPYLLAAEDVALAVIPALLPVCESASAARCVRTDYGAPLARLFRRPLSDAEVTSWAALIVRLQSEGVPALDATRAMLTAALLTPDFLFRIPGWEADESARPRRLAELLSYALVDEPPDTELTETANGPRASLSERLRIQAARLSTDARAVPVLARFFGQWLHVDTDLRLLEPAFETSPRYREWLAFVGDAMQNDIPITSLIAGRRGFVHRDSLAAYGLDAVDIPGGSDVAAVTWPVDSVRRGLLGQELILDSTRHPDPGRRVIFRGALIRKSLLCDPIPAPSADLLALAAEVGDRTTDARCAGCHVRLDPIGTAFGVLDADDEGASRSAEIIGHPELDGVYPSVPALLDAVATSRAFAECFSRHWLSFFLEHAPVDADAAWVSGLADALQSGASLRDILEQTIVTLEVRSEASVPWCQGP